MVTLTAGGAVTGFSFVPGTAADLSSPTGVPVHLMALEHAARPSADDDAALRTAIVNVSHYYLRLAKGKSPAQMRAMIWQKESPSGIDHGATCAAFASLTLEMAAQAVGRHSWVSGGSTYPYPLYDWADVRVEPNPSSPQVMSVEQDAKAHHRWHPLGDGYQPMPGDWVLFNGHMEVVTGDEGGLLRTIGANSLPDYTVNAHEFPAPLATQGVIGFVNNGSLPPSAATDSGVTSARDQSRAPSSNGSATQDADGGSSVPGFEVLSDTGRADPATGHTGRSTPAFAPDPAKRGSTHTTASANQAAIPDLTPASPPALAAEPGRQHEPASSNQQTQNQQTQNQQGQRRARPAQHRHCPTSQVSSADQDRGSRRRSSRRRRGRRHPRRASPASARRPTRPGSARLRRDRRSACSARHNPGEAPHPGLPRALPGRALDREPTRNS